MRADSPGASAERATATQAWRGADRRGRQARGYQHASAPVGSLGSVPCQINRPGLVALTWAGLFDWRAIMARRAATRSTVNQHPVTPLAQWSFGREGIAVPFTLVKRPGVAAEQRIGPTW
jgi:hypothetical protein